MIIIIGALSQWGKEWWRLLNPWKSGDAVHDIVLKNEKKNERKREKEQRYYLFTTLVLQTSTMFFI